MPSTPPPGLVDADFDRIESAVMETERGRWFLAEYAHRIRAAGTDGLAASLARIEAALEWGEPALSSDAARRISAQTRAIRERLQDLAWRLREEGSEQASALIEAEIAALDGCRSFPSPAARARSSAAGDEGEGPGDLSRRLRSISGLAPQADRLLASPKKLELAEVLPPELGLEDRLPAFAALDALSPEEKLAFFA